jgi:hypothetical protein
MASHRGEQKRVHALFLPVLDHVPHNGRDVVNAAAADANGDSRSGLEPACESAGGELIAHFGGNIRNLPVWKVLTNYKKAGELHVGFILTPRPPAGEPRLRPSIPTSGNVLKRTPNRGHQSAMSYN